MASWLTSSWRLTYVLCLYCGSTIVIAWKMYGGGVGVVVSGCGGHLFVKVHQIPIAPVQSSMYFVLQFY